MWLVVPRGWRGPQAKPGVGSCCFPSTGLLQHLTSVFLWVGSSFRTEG